MMNDPDDLVECQAECARLTAALNDVVRALSRYGVHSGACPVAADEERDDCICGYTGMLEFAASTVRPRR